MRGGETGSCFVTTADVPRAADSTISLTMSCSPLTSPRLLSGSSGIMWRGRGGYPDFTTIGSEYLRRSIVERTHSSAARAEYRKLHIFLVADPGQ